MILLTTPLPTNQSELLTTLTALINQAIAGAKISAIGEFPSLQTLSIDLTHAAPIPLPAATWLTTPGQSIAQCTADNLIITGHPFGAPNQTVTLDLTAASVRAEFVRAADNQIALRLAAARNGNLRAILQRTTLEAALLIHANQAASAQGVSIKELHLTWQTAGPRTLTAQVQVKAKKGFLPAANIAAQGTLTIDPSLNATLSNLTINGEGMVGSLAAGVIRPKLQKLEGTTRSLLAFPLDAIQIKDVQIQTTPDALTIYAAFEG